MITIYIFSRLWEPVLQVFDALDVSVTERTNESWFSEFSIPVFTPDGKIHPALSNVSYLAKFNRVKIGAIISGEEKEVFDGYIDEVEDTSTRTTVRVSSYLSYLENRIITANTSCSSTTVASILAGVFASMNTADDTGISVSCDVSDIVTKSWTGGTTISAIVKDLAESGYSYIMKGKTLYFGSVGADRTTVGDNYMELIYDAMDSRLNTITDFTFSSQSRNLKNDIYTKAGTIINATDTVSVSEYGKQQAYISTKNNAELQKYLSEHKEDVMEVDITPSPTAEIADIGDKIRVIINRGDSRANIDTSATVTQKTLDFRGPVSSISLKISTSSVRSPSILEKIRTMESDIQKLRLS